MNEFVYRARGRYTGTGRESWITKSWRRTEDSAKSDIIMFGNRYTHTSIKKLNYIAYANKHKHYPKITEA
jgi:hypothetical protein